MVHLPSLVQSFKILHKFPVINLHNEGNNCGILRLLERLWILLLFEMKLGQAGLLLILQCEMDLI